MPFNLKRLGLRLAAGALAMTAIAALSAGPHVTAHNWNRCNDGKPIQWAQPATTQGVPITFPGSYQRAIAGGVENFNTSHFQYSLVDVTTAKVPWRDMASLDTNIAGAAGVSLSCSTHTITSGRLYLNSYHINAKPHTDEQIQCTAIHEMAHIAGFTHNSLISVLRTPHGTRCHNMLIKTLQPHDYDDINGRY